VEVGVSFVMHLFRFRLVCAMQLTHNLKSIQHMLRLYLLWFSNEFLSVIVCNGWAFDINGFFSLQVQKRENWSWFE